jgi:hypothetical protein
VEIERDITGTAWADAFATPTLETLLGELDEADRTAFEAVAEALGGRDGWAGELSWLGLPWRWALVFGAREFPALAYVVPDPRGPRVCVPVPAVGDGAPEITKLTKPVRQVLERSAIIAGSVWAEWACADFDPVAAEPLLASRDGA